MGTAGWPTDCPRRSSPVREPDARVLPAAGTALRDPAPHRRDRDGPGRRGGAGGVPGAVVGLRSVSLRRLGSACMSLDHLDVERVLAGLKDFQRRTVDYVFQRMWLDGL